MVLSFLWGQLVWSWLCKRKLITGTACGNHLAVRQLWVAVEWEAQYYCVPIISDIHHYAVGCGYGQSLTKEAKKGVLRRQDLNPQPPNSKVHSLSTSAHRFLE